jgi:prevent-host-death family protein
MGTVTMRELRNKGAEVMDRVERGESLTVTRDGRPVAELHPIRNKGTSTELLIERRRHLPPVDYQKMRAELDEIIDPSLW